MVHLVDDLLGLGFSGGYCAIVIFSCLGELLIAHRSRELRHQLNWDGHLAARALVLEAQTERLLIHAGGLKLLHLVSAGGAGLEELHDLSAVQVDILQAEITDTTQRPVRTANIVEGGVKPGEELLFKILVAGRGLLDKRPKVVLLPLPDVLHVRDDSSVGFLCFWVQRVEGSLCFSMRGDEALAGGLVHAGCFPLILCGLELVGSGLLASRYPVYLGVNVLPRSYPVERREPGHKVDLLSLL